MASNGARTGRGERYCGDPRLTPSSTDAATGDRVRPKTNASTSEPLPAIEGNAWGNSLENFNPNSARRLWRRHELTHAVDAVPRRLRQRNIKPPWTHRAARQNKA